MGRINWGRVFLGGLLAGVVINVGEFLFHAVLFKDQMAEMMRALGKDPATIMTDGAVAIWNLLGFLTGIAAVWLYAAIRPRYGAGAKTAAIAGVGAWFIGRVLEAVGQMNMGLFPQRIILIGLVWGLVELIVATTAGAWAYKEA